MRHFTKSTLPLTIVVACLTAAGSASATITFETGATATIQNEVSDGSAVAYDGDQSASDLLNGLSTATNNGNWFTSSGRGPGNLVDGAHGTAAEVGSLAQTETPPAVVVFNLGTGDNGTGYDLTEIVSIAAWGQNVGFGNQVWTLEVAGVGADGGLASTDFDLMVTANFQPFSNSGNTDGASKVTLSGLSGDLTSGVQFLRLTGLANPEGASSRFAWREFDVVGTSTAVPEPSSFALLAGCFGLASVMMRRRS